MDETLRGRRNVLPTMYDSELMRCYNIKSCRDHVCDRSYLDNANIDTVQKCHSARNGRNHYINIFRNWKNACSFPIKYVKYDSMVNKKIKNIYTYIMCVCE